MKGKLILIPISSPKEGMKVVVIDKYEEEDIKNVGILEKIYESIWRIKFPNGRIILYSKVQQIAVEFGHKSVIPLHPSDYEQALPLIGKEISFSQIQGTETDYGSPIKNAKHSQFYAKLILPSKVVYDENDMLKAFQGGWERNKQWKEWIFDYKK